MANDKNLGLALKNGDLDKVKEIIESDVSGQFQSLFIIVPVWQLIIIDCFLVFFGEKRYRYYAVINI